MQVKYVLGSQTKYYEMLLEGIKSRCENPLFSSHSTACRCTQAYLHNFTNP